MSAQKKKQQQRRKNPIMHAWRAFELSHSFLARRTLDACKSHSLNKSTVAIRLFVVVFSLFLSRSFSLLCFFLINITHFKHTSASASTHYLTIQNASEMFEPMFGERENVHKSNGMAQHSTARHGKTMHRRILKGSHTITKRKTWNSGEKKINV